MNLKKNFLAWLIAIPTLAQAFELKVTLMDQVIFSETGLQSQHLSLGKLSDQRFTEALSNGRIHSYLGSPSGLSAIDGHGSEMEILSDQAMNAYGWCFEVDGKRPVFLADQYYFHGTEKTVEWYYAYAHSERNTWTSMCERATHLPSRSP